MITEYHNLSGPELIPLLGEPVCVATVGRNPSINGNVYTIDPATKSIVLVQFTSPEDIKPSKFLFIPGDSIKTVEKLTLAGRSDDGAIEEDGKINAANVRMDVQNVLADLRRLFSTEEAPSSYNADDNARVAADEPSTSSSKAGDNSSQLKERYNKITAFLDKHQISYKKDLLGDGEKVIVIGAIKITSPYARNNVVSANMNAVRKTTALLKDVLEES